MANALPQPALLVQLLDAGGAGAAAAAPAPAGAGAWLQLSPDTMHQHRLESQQTVMVGLCAPGAAASPAAAARSGSPSPSRFGPAVPELSLADVHLVDLWARSGLLAAGTAGLAGDEQLPGRFLLPLSLWPCARLPRGAGQLSGAAWSRLLRPAAGEHLALYVLQPESAPQQAPLLRLQLCIEPETGLPLTPSHATAAAGPSLAAAQPGLGTPPPRARASPRAAAKTPGSSGKKAQGSGSRARSSQAPERGSGGGQPAADRSAAVWQLQLLADGIDWSRPRQRQLLQQLAHKELLGQAFLPGNLACLPVLGVELLFQAPPDAAQAPQQPAQHEPRLPQPLLLTAATQLQLAMPGDTPSAGTAGPAATAGAAQPAAVAAALGAPAAQAGGAVLDVERRVHLAREAAQQAVQGSTAEAAADAAERAVRAGAAATAAAGGYSRLGGIASYSQALRELVLLPLQLPQLFAKYKLRPPRGLLLHGPPGSGKTALARAAAVEAGAALLIVNGPDVLTEFYGESEAGLSGVFAAAAALSPAIIFIDEVDALAPSRDAAGHGGGSAHAAGAGGSAGSGAAGEAAARVLTQLLALMDGLESSSDGGGGGGGGSTAGAVAAAAVPRVVVLAASNRPAALDPALRRPGRFERELEVGVPDPSARADILRVRLASVRHDLTPQQVQQLAATTHGFVGADLAALVNEAALSALRRHVAALHAQQPGQAAPGQAKEEQPACKQQQQGEQQPPPLCVCWQDFVAARLLVKPSALREVAVEVPQVSWDDVGGLADVKQRLQEAVLWPATRGAALARLGAAPPRGLLLHGPPGGGKTALARAAAASCGLNFLAVKGGELVGAYVGEAERAVAGLFARARAAAPALVFFDELDGLVGARPPAGGDGGAGGGGVAERVLAQLLTELDGLQPRLGVVVLAATNRPDALDPALLRPGRFDRLLLVPPPDAAGRAEVLAVHTRRTPLAADVDLRALAARTEGYSGADLRALCREAAMAALQEDLGSAAVAARHFDVALLRVAPSDGAGCLAPYLAFQRGSGLQAA